MEAKGSALKGSAVEADGSACMQMADGAAELQEAVVRLCCLWWQKELPGKADMVPQMVPYLLYQATVSGATSGNSSVCSSACAMLHSCMLYSCKILLDTSKGTV